MLRDCPVLGRLILAPSKTRDSDNTILHKVFRGGSLSIVGANSGRGFRRVSRRVMAFDETDGYPLSAGVEGDPIKLGIRRTEYYWNRKIIAGSTPTLAGLSRIERLFLAGDQRRYYVPCTECGHMDFLVFRQETTEEGEPVGHFMHWPSGHPESAHFVCRDVRRRHRTPGQTGDRRGRRVASARAVYGSRQLPYLGGLQLLAECDVGPAREGVPRGEHRRARPAEDVRQHRPG
jgi:phage terminase large subunit GpA-like protein